MNIFDTNESHEEEFWEAFKELLWKSKLEIKGNLKENHVSKSWLKGRGGLWEIDFQNIL